MTALGHRFNVFLPALGCRQKPVQQKQLFFLPPGHLACAATVHGGISQLQASNLSVVVRRHAGK